MKIENNYIHVMSWKSILYFIRMILVVNCQNFSPTIFSGCPMICHREKKFPCEKCSCHPQRHLELCTKYSPCLVFGWPRPFSTFFQWNLPELFPISEVCTLTSGGLSFFHSTYFLQVLHKHRRCLSYKVNLVLRKSQPSSETSI